MKKVKWFFTWIIKNKEWLFSGIGITLFSLIFTIYVRNRDSITDVNDTSSNENNTEISDDVNKDIYQDSTINNYNIEINEVSGGIYKDTIINNNNIKHDDKQQIIMSETKYLEYLQSNADGDVIFYHYNDYDGDGACEMFALVGDEITSTLVGEGENLYGKIWFINEDGIMEIESNEIEYWTSPYKFSVKNNIFIAFEKAYTTGSQTFIWGVRDGKPYQPNISGKVHGLKINEYDEIEVIHSTYDLEYYKELDVTAGHTWKKYYFYFDGNTFREYGGINVDVEDVMKIPEIKKIIDEIYDNSYKIDSIYYRDNQIININISYETDEYIRYNNISLRYIKDVWKIVSSDEFGQDYGEGYYFESVYTNSCYLS